MAMLCHIKKPSQLMMIKLAGGKNLLNTDGNELYLTVCVGIE
jgi:hypothetical protein